MHTAIALYLLVAYAPGCRGWEARAEGCLRLSPRLLGAGKPQSKTIGLEEPRSRSMNSSAPTPSHAQGTPQPPSVQTWWRTAALALVIVILILAVLPLTLQRQESFTAVKWSRVSIEAQLPANISSTILPPGKFCAPADATSAGLFSLLWNTSGPVNLTFIRVTVLLAELPLTVQTLYQANDSRAGGTSFASTFPFPCADDWFLYASANQVETVSVAMALIYNYTASVAVFPGF